MDVLDAVPLFPLSDVVLLPEVSVPLFIFEPRYRQMTRHALAGSHRIGMVTVRPDAIGGMAGDPPLFEIGCLGRIAHAQERPDGTFQIMLVGERRFRILEEQLPEGERLFRTARVELLNDAIPATPDEVEAMRVARDELLELLERLVHRVGTTENPAEAVSAFARLDSARLVNALTQSIALRPVERQQLLEADSVVGRFNTMSDLLRFRLAETGVGETDSGRLPN